MTYHVRIFTGASNGWAGSGMDEYKSPADATLTLDAHLAAEADSGYYLDSMDTCGVDALSVRVVTKSRQTWSAS